MQWQIVIIILAYITAHTFTFLKIFISPYGFEILSSILSFHPAVLLEHFFQGRASDHISLSFSLSGNVSVSPSTLKGSFARCRMLGWQFFPLSTLKILAYCLLASIVSDERSASLTLLRILYMCWPFSLANFKIICSSFELSFETLSSSVFWNFDYNVP